MTASATYGLANEKRCRYCYNNTKTTQIMVVICFFFLLHMFLVVVVVVYLIILFTLLLFFSFLSLLSPPMHSKHFTNLFNNNIYGFSFVAIALYCRMWVAICCCLPGIFVAIACHSTMSLVSAVSSLLIVVCEPYFFFDFLKAAL